MSNSFGEILDRHKGNGPGFDLLRIGLAITIVYVHSIGIAGGPPAAAVLTTNAQGQIALNVPTDFGPALWAILRQIKSLLTFNSTDTRFIELLVPMFFSLSGFLVTGSAFRTRNLPQFLAFRILRIVPALFTEVSLSALCLGPLLTVVPLSVYFSDGKFYAYFGNIVGHIQYLLPGLFINNPIEGVVNGNLWTLPPEFYCYLLIALLIASGLLFSRTIFSALFIVGTGAVMWLNPAMNDTSHPVYCFFCGAMFFHWREHVPFSPWLIALSAAIIYVQMVGPSSYYFYPAFLSYLTVCIGLTRLPRISLFQKGDYSYGVYLYGFPITQALVLLIPQLKGHGVLLFVVGLPVVLAFAILSWHAIEKPCLALKRVVSRWQSPTHALAPSEERP